jgi:UDP-N-acetylglucosamine acyltransferase
MGRLSLAVWVGLEKGLGIPRPWPSFFGVIHPTAIVHPAAQVDSTCEIGPYAVIDAAVVLGPRCRLGPHVHFTGHTTVGAENTFHAGCVIGDAPQDLKYKGVPTRLRIGDRNVFREHVTVNRSNKLDEDTVIGADCFLMAHAHVAHNCHLGNGVIMANDATLGGHVSVGDRAFLSANCLVHQFTRVGSLALMQGGSAISQDLPPFCLARGHNVLCGLNTIGLRRAGFTTTERLELRQLFHYLFREGRNLRAALVEAHTRFTGAPARCMMEFLEAAKRGVVAVAAARGGDGDDED